MAKLKSKKAVNVKFTAEQKKAIKAQITLAVEEAYFQGREDEALAQEKIAIAREKVILAAAAKFDKDRKKSEKITTTKTKVAKKASTIKKAKKAPNIANESSPKKRGRPPKAKIEQPVEMSTPTE